MKFYKGDIFYSLVRSSNVTSDGNPIFLYSAWNKSGQGIAAGEIEATCIEHAKQKLLNN